MTMTSKEAKLMMLEEQRFTDEVQDGEEYDDDDGADLHSPFHNGTDVDPNERAGNSTEISMTEKEIRRIRMFRVMVVGMLVMTGLVTGISHYFLNREENRNFQTAYAQFARTLGDAALEEQKKIKDALVTLATRNPTTSDTAIQIVSTLIRLSIDRTLPNSKEGRARAHLSA